MAGKALATHSSLDCELVYRQLDRGFIDVHASDSEGGEHSCATRLGIPRG